MLRPATDSDLPAMRAWRNQDANRAVSLTQHEIGADEHTAWWAGVQADPARRVLVFELDGRALGVVTFFDLTPATAPERASWGFYLDHDGTAADGTGLLAWTLIMREAVDHAFAAPPDGLGVDELCGEVLADNEAVRAMNRRFRFAEGTPEVRPVGGTLREVIPIRLTRADHRARRTTAGAPTARRMS